MRFLTTSALSFAVVSSPLTTAFSTHGSLAPFWCASQKTYAKMSGYTVQCLPLMQSKQAISAHFVIWWTETEENENEQLRKNHYVLWNSPRNVRTRSITNTLGSRKSTQRGLNNLRKTLPKNVKNLKEDREKLEWGGRSAYSWYHSFLFSFNIAKISWLMYSHAGLYVSKCRINHVMWSPQISQAKPGWANKMPWEEASKEHLHGIWSRAGEWTPNT